jgi:hypothetical protein
MKNLCPLLETYKKSEQGEKEHLIVFLAENYSDALCAIIRKKGKGEVICKEILTKIKERGHNDQRRTE